MSRSQNDNPKTRRATAKSKKAERSPKTERGPKAERGPKTERGPKAERDSKSENKALSIRLLNALQKADGKQISSGDLMRILNLPRQRKTAVRRTLRDLVESGKAVRKGNGYRLGSKAGGAGKGGKKSAVSTGRLVGHADGFGFIIRPDGDDVFVPRREIKSALHGDTVSIRVQQGHDGRFSGTGLKIVERGCTSLVGRLEKWRGRWRVIPLDGRLGHPVYVHSKSTKQARAGELVEVSITGYPENGENMTGRVSNTLGDGTDPLRDSDLVLAELGVDPAFPAQVLAAAEALPDKVDKSHHTGRKDLRKLPTVTIDGETAKDFDDAISLEAGEDGSATLWVHIADVDHWAPEGTELDQEAAERATSIYLPDRVIPMFPEAVSNGLCSLRPKVDRLTLTVEMRFNRLGRIGGMDVYPSVINSNARLTYTEVNQMLVDRDEKVRKQYTDLLPMLEQMGKLGEKRRKVRSKRGSLDFDLPELIVALGDGGEISEIVQQPREISHRLIEEFMLVANEAVAGWLTLAKWPMVYRVHEAPELERLNQFVPVARNILGTDVELPYFKDTPTPKGLQQILARAQGHPAEQLVNTLMVRSLKQARYTEQHIPHFGLAAECYGHFTSPIRRYPDLMVHRLVKHRLAGKKWQGLSWVKSLPETALHCSERERRAITGERRVNDIKKVRYLANKVGDRFDGVISSVTRFGLFVTLEGIGYEGLVPAESLPGKVSYDERRMQLQDSTSSMSYRIGDPLKVQIVKVDTLAARVTLDPIEE